MKKWCPILLLTAALTALGQALPEEALTAVRQAREYVLLATPSLDSEPLARALWEASVQRGAKVYILIPPKEAQAPYSYTASLHLAGVKLRLAQVSHMELLADGRYFGPRDKTSFQSRFSRAWKMAPTYIPNLQPEGVRVVPYDPFQQYQRLLEEALRQDARRRLLGR